MVEQLICNQQVAGSSPVLGSSNLGLDSREGYPSGQRGQTVNLLAKPSKVRILLPPPCRGMEQLVARRAHNPKVVGSNPSPATKRNEGSYTEPFPIGMSSSKKLTISRARGGQPGRYSAHPEVQLPIPTPCIFLPLKLWPTKSFLGN